jgi:sensor domain CHASE-containing protein
MKKSPILKAFIIIVLIFFILSTGLMFILYMASPSTVLELEDQNIQEVVEDDTQQ